MVVQPSRNDWSKLLENALWAHRTTYQTPLGMSPYRVVFGKACHFPVEIKHRAWRDPLRSLWELQDLQGEVKRFYNSRILRKEFRIGQKMFLFNSRLKLIYVKLQSRWDEPFFITNVFPHSVVEIINEVIDKVFKVNGHQLKFFHESPQVEEEFVANLSLVLPILCDYVPWMTLEEFPFLFFYMLSLCLHFITCSHWGTMCISSVGGRFRKKIVCFLFFVFFVFCFYLAIFYFFYFIVPVRCSIFYCFMFHVFCFAVFFCFTFFFTVLHTENKNFRLCNCCCLMFFFIV